MTGPRLRTAAGGLVVDDYFLVRTEAFDPRGSFDDAALAAHNGPEVFGHRDLPTLYADLLRDGAPATPRALGH